jgi:hypothetical protein
MKPAGKSEARIMLSARIFHCLKTCFNLAKPMLLSVETVKAFATGANAFQIRLGAWHARPLYVAALGFVCDYLRRSFIDFKLGTHFLDLRSLLF